MKILDIKVGKNKSTIKVGDNQYIFATEIVYKERLTTGRDISGKDFFLLKDQSDKLLAKQYLFTLLSRQIKSKLQAKKKLKEKGYYSKAIEYALEKAEEYNLIDDENYARCYINTYINRKGSKLIKYELRKAGVDDNTIENLMEGREEDILLAAKNCAHKFIRIKKDAINKDKLYRHLYNKGFDYDTIKNAIASVLAESREDE